MNAEAKRMGGGKSMGQQSSNVTQREAVKPAGAPGVAQAPAAAAPHAGPAAAAPKRPWGAMLGGLAAGLGLAWLAHSMGFGEGFGQFLMIGLMVMLAMMAFGAFMRSRRAAGTGTAAGPFAMQGAGAGAANPTMARSYSPDNVGNDASARPWERTSTFDAADKPQNSRFQSGEQGSMIGSALGGSQAWGVPADFDAAGFLTAAKRNFVTLQDAWDRSDIASLRAMMTDSMLGEIQSQLAERETHTGGSANKTEVVMLDANLLGIEDLGQGYMASVEFTGMIREDQSSGPSAFREVWNMTKTKSGGGWLVAGVQALQ
jgi:predicted lipid-binding transport protein (Tim44 family)